MTCWTLTYWDKVFWRHHLEYEVHRLGTTSNDHPSRDIHRYLRSTRAVRNRASDLVLNPTGQVIRQGTL